MRKKQKCIKCGKEKPIEKFNFKNEKKGLRISCCKRCKRKYDREYWDKTKEKKNKRKYLNVREISRRNRGFIFDYLAKHPCADCGEDDPVVLDFDHLYKDKNKKRISRMIGSSIDSIKKEIARCAVRCANCHRRKTAKEHKWYEGFKRKELYKQTAKLISKHSELHDCGHYEGYYINEKDFIKDLIELFYKLDEDFDTSDEKEFMGIIGYVR